MASLTTASPGRLERARRAAEALAQWPWRDTLRLLRRRFREDRLGLTASSLTFTTLIALVPLLTLMLAVFSAFPMFSAFQLALEKYFLQSLVPDNIARPVLRALTQFAQQARSMGSIGLLLFAVTAVAMMLTIDRTLNAIWRVRKPRPLSQRVLVYWAALTLGPLVLGVSLWTTSWAVSASRGIVERLPGGVSLLFDALEFGLLAAAMAGLFRTVPNTYVRWSHAWAGALFVAVGIDGAKRALAWYVDAAGTFSAVYGAFATVPILLLWVFLGWVIVLLGAVIAAYAPSVKAGLQGAEDSAGYRFELALAMLRELQRARAGQRHGLALEQLAAALRREPLLIESLLWTLVELDLVGRLDEEGAQRWVLLADAERTSAGPLIDALLLAPNPGTRAFRDAAAWSSMKLGALLRD